MVGCYLQRAPQEPPTGVLPPYDCFHHRRTTMLTPCDPHHMQITPIGLKLSIRDRHFTFAL
jgi:hypothetical protein